MFVGDGERDRVVATLREHFVRGRLTVEELSSRTEKVLVARSRTDLQSALTGLPPFLDVRELAARGRSIADAAIRGVVLLVLTGAYVLFSLALVLVLGLTLLVHGASTFALLGFLIVWLAPTYLLSRVWRRRPTNL
jgi:Domain of unknown function (DUF1707)